MTKEMSRSGDQTSTDRNDREKLIPSDQREGDVSSTSSWYVPDSEPDSEVRGVFSSFGVRISFMEVEGVNAGVDGADADLGELSCLACTFSILLTTSSHCDMSDWCISGGDLRPAS